MYLLRASKFIKQKLTAIKKQTNPQTVLDIFNNRLSVTDKTSRQKFSKEVSDKSYWPNQCL